MPELPEVETIRSGLAQAVVGHVVRAVPWVDARLVRGPVGADELGGRLVGQRGSAVARRGKFLVWQFETGTGLLLHLGMSGRVVVEPDPEAPRRPHTHLVVELSTGAQVRLSDPRRFGRVAWLPRASPLPLRLGIEPLSAAFTARRLGAMLEGRRAPVKALLLDQRLVAGLGNIYVDEALFRAGVHPLRPGGDVAPGDVARLHRAIRRVLKDAIQDRGTTFLDYRDAHGEVGAHQRRLQVYRRAGQPCRRCGEPIRRMVVAGRGSHICPRCQPAPVTDATAAADQPSHSKMSAARRPIGG
jgi:formamidopyrimidine-DNA glycosylase